MKTKWEFNEIKNISKKIKLNLWDYQIRIIQNRIPKLLYLLHSFNTNNLKGQTGGSIYDNILKEFNDDFTNIKFITNDLSKIHLNKCTNLNNLSINSNRELFNYLLNGNWKDASSILITEI